MIDQRLKEKLLPYQFWARNAIKGEKDCNSEYYLREMLNASTYFKEKSHDHTYFAPESEENGQCDAISQYYEIDFKNLISSSMGRARANTDFQIEQILPGCYATVPARDTSGKIYKAGNLLKILRDYTYEDLLNGRYDSASEIEVNDINDLVEVSKTPKNILFYLPTQFSVSETVTIEESQNILKEAMIEDAYKLFRLRGKMAPGWDTYLCTILDDQFVIFGDNNIELYIADIVDTTLSNTYCHIVSLSL